MKKLSIMVLTILTCSCVSPYAELVNENGQRVVCQAKGFGLLSGTMANNRFQQCVSDAQMRGFNLEKSE